MTTEALLETILIYPLIGSLFAFNTFKQGFEVVSSNFNGLAELRSREGVNELNVHKLNTKTYSNDENYPDATRLRSATSYYNCHSYAWYSTSSSNKYWMNDPSAYMEDGSYDEINPKAGAKIYYYGEHSEIVNSTSSRGISVTSKWGKAGLYKHEYDDCPYSVDDLSYWKWKKAL